jgi:hypothetical protein
VVDFLHKDGLHSKKDITIKYKNFKQSMHSFKRTRDNLSNTVGEDSTPQLEDSYYQVKKGKVGTPMP